VRWFDCRQAAKVDDGWKTADAGDRVDVRCAVFVFYWVDDLRQLLLVGMVGFSFFKGLYDANLFAGLYDVVPVAWSSGWYFSLTGWLGGGFAPVVIAVGAAGYGMSACLSATAAIYLAVSVMLFVDAIRGCYSCGRGVCINCPKCDGDTTLTA